MFKKLETKMTESVKKEVKFTRSVPVKSKRESSNILIRQSSLPLMTEAESAPTQNCRRLVVLGSPKVGKSSLVSRFLNNTYDEKHTPTIEDFHRKIYRIKGEAYRLDILDTSGLQPFPAMRRLSFLTGDLFLLVYSVDSKESFEEVKRLKSHIIEAKERAQGLSKYKKKLPIPMVIVGNKSDLSDNREVTADDILELNSGFPHCSHLSVSAKLNEGIDDIFCKLFHLAKLPTEMSPSLHRKVHPSYVGHSPGSLRRTMTLRRRSSDVGAVAPNVRRPSIRTDLLIMQTKQNLMNGVDDSKTNTKCVIQ